MQKKAVFLDRDGTLIIDKVYLNDPEQIVYLPRVIEGLKIMRDHGFVFLVATNQSGVARGIVSIKNLDEIHRRIAAEFSRNGIDILNFYSAPFMTDSDHILRKPNPGMILEGATHFNIDLSQSWMIGDRMSDVEAGHRAGCRSILIRGAEPIHGPFSPPEAEVDDLFEAAHVICAPY